MIVVLVILVSGMCLSAFFSGSETGFYRVNRMRLMLDARAGDWISGGLLRLANHPSMFVPTVLVGNNLANYLTSLTAVFLAQDLSAGRSHLLEILIPLLLAPVLFVYGELLPKHVFYHVPNRMLRRVGAPILVFTVLLLPVTIVLWAIGKLLEWLSGEASDKVQFALARKELGQVFEEGHEAGILHGAQRGLAQGLFSAANQPVAAFVTPAGRVARIRLGTSKAEVRRLARRHRLAAIPVEEAGGARRLIGYVRTIDLYLNDSDEVGPLRPLVKISANETHIAALMRLQASGESLAHVVDAQGRSVGFLTARQLSEPLFGGQ